MTDDRVSLWGSGRRLAADIAQYQPRLLALVVVLLLARGATEGLSYLVLVPLLGMVDATSLTAGIGANGAASPWLRIGSLGIPSSVGTALGLFVALMLARAALTYASQCASSNFHTGFVESLRRRLYVALTRASWPYLAGTRQSKDIQALTEQCDVAGAATMLIVNLISAMLTILCGMLAAWSLSPRLTLAVVFACALAALPMLLFQRWAYAQSLQVLRAMHALYDVMHARVGGLKLAKAFAIEQEMEADFTAVSKAHRVSVMAVHENTARATLVQESSASLLLAAVVGLGSLFFAVSGAELVAVIVVFARVAPLILGTQTNVRALAASLPSYDDLMTQVEKAKSNADVLPDNQSPLVAVQEIMLDNVSYAHPGFEDRPVIRALSLTLKAGSVVGIVGASGAGKSTLADLIAGLIVPTCGRVVVDGAPLDDVTRPRWRAGVTYVTQDAPLFHASLRENLRIGARGASDEDIWRCLEVVGAADLVRQMADGLGTMAGDNGVRLSGGERQRIRLASALLRQPQMLILDESTSAMSPEDEKHVIAGLRSWPTPMTILTIAHRQSSIDWVDRVIRLRAGTIISDGTPTGIHLSPVDATPA